MPNNPIQIIFLQVNIKRCITDYKTTIKKIKFLHKKMATKAIFLKN
jgi:hypothetical protein